MNDKLPALTELTGSLRAGRRTEHAVSVDLGGCVIAVATDDAPLAAELTAYFQEFLTDGASPDITITALESPAPELDLPFAVKQPDPGKTKIKEEYCDLDGGRVVRKRLTGMIFAFGGGDNLAVGPCRDNANQVINFVNNRFIERELNLGSQLGHAAGVCLCERGLALAGFSGMGKSTLAMRLMSLGTTFVSNDRLLVSRGADGLVMRGVPKQPRVNPGTLLGNDDLAWMLDASDRAELLALPEKSLWQLERKYDALIVDCFGPGKFVLKTSLDGLAILNWRHGAGPTVVKRVNFHDRPDLLAAFMKETGLFYLPEGAGAGLDRGPAAYAALFEDTPVIEFTGGVDFGVAGAACRDFLENKPVAMGG